MMDDILSKVRELSTELTLLDEYFQKLKQLKNKRMEDGLTEYDGVGIDSQMRALNQMNNEQCDRIKEGLLEFGEQIIKKKKKYKDGDFLLETMKSHYHSITNRLREKIIRYRELQLLISKHEKDILKKQLKILHPKINEDDLEKLALSQDKESKRLFDVRTDANQELVNNAEKRKMETISILDNIEELIFRINELDLMVKRSDFLIDRIQNSESQANVYIERGNVDLRRALRHQQRWTSIKKIFYMAFMLIFMIFLIYLGIKFDFIGKLRGNKGGDGV